MKKKTNLNLPSEDNNSKVLNPIFSDVTYQFVFCARYRRKIFKEFESQAIEWHFRQELHAIEEAVGFHVCQCRCEEERVYLTIQAPPTLSPADIMAKIKNKTSRVIRHQIEGLSHLQGLWTRAYYVTTQAEFHVDEVERFVSLQKTRS